MRLSVMYLLLSLSISTLSYAQNVDDRLKYMEQTPPSLIPEIFAPNLISKKNEYEFGSVFNREATEFFYGVNKWEVRNTIFKVNRRQMEYPSDDLIS